MGLTNIAMHQHRRDGSVQRRRNHCPARAFSTLGHTQQKPDMNGRRRGHTPINVHRARGLIFFGKRPTVKSAI